MSTKKQRRAAGEAKAAREAEEARLSGLRAQQRDREHRAWQRERVDEKSTDWWSSSMTDKKR